MKRFIWCIVLVLTLSFVVMTNASAGKLEDELFGAIYNADVEAVRALIRSGADVNAKNELGGSVYGAALGQACLIDDPRNDSDCDKIDMILDMLEAAGARL